MCCKTRNDNLQHKGYLIMAFRKAAGYNNLPNGVWSPVIYSKKVQLAFRKNSIVNDISNNE